MNSNGLLSKHWLSVAFRFTLDASLFIVGYLLGLGVRFGGESFQVFDEHWTSILLRGVAVSSCVYIFGLYSLRSAHQNFFHRSMILFLCTTVAVAVTLGFNYLTMSEVLGRGAMFIGAGLGYLLVLTHHTVLMNSQRNYRERVAYIVGSNFDEMETRLFDSLAGKHLQLVGIIEYDGYKAVGKAPVLGDTRDLLEIAQKEGVQRILCTGKNLNDPSLSKQFCQLRYSGVIVMPLITLCEEVDQCVPVELVTPEWLLNASGEPHHIYIQKTKRLTDILLSLTFLVVGSPILLLGMALVRITSRGPIFYHQTRAGRFGRLIKVIKLRTMSLDAEKDGPVWSSGSNDPRLTPLGGFLRRFRIDEIPQLFNVLRGDMSFVGPRPERPEMIEKLATETPFYLERTLIQPGITGWAQVNYPYGASVEDARRKLEYDLYYMKHMSVFLDMFILFDTIRIVLAGGVSDTSKSIPQERVEAMQAWTKARPVASDSWAVKSRTSKIVV